MSKELAKKESMDAIEQTLLKGDLAGLTPAQRGEYYNAVCTSLNLNPLTRPFEYITLNNKLTLYARRDCTDQLRKRDNISIKITAREQVGDIFMVTAQAVNGEGRTDESIGAVNIAGLKGDALANAYMRAETKAKRRVALSICGLGIMDETEAETVPQAKPFTDSSSGLPKKGAPAQVEPFKGFDTPPAFKPPRNSSQMKEATMDYIEGDLTPEQVEEPTLAEQRVERLKDQLETSESVQPCKTCGQVLEDPFSQLCPNCQKDFRKKYNALIVLTCERLYGIPQNNEGKGSRLVLYKACIGRPITGLKDCDELEMERIAQWLQDDPPSKMEILKVKKKDVV